MFSARDSRLARGKLGRQSTTSSRPMPISNSSASEISSRGDVRFSTAETLLAILKEAGEMTQNIPYIKAVSGVCLQILKMKAEVDILRDKWSVVMADIAQISELVDDYCKQFDAAEAQDQEIPADLQRVFKVLERTLQATLVALDRCQPKRKRDRIWLVLNRAQLITSIDECGSGIQKALNLFNTKLNVGNRTDTARIWDAIQTKVKIVSVEDKPIAPELRAPSETMFGREREIQEMVTAIEQSPPARIAILGPGGMGKTSLALSVLHHPAIAAEFLDARYFVPCDAAQSADALLLELANALGIATDSSFSAEKIFAFLRSSKSILCLDNFETPWDVQTRLVEELLAKITSIPSVTVLVTMRGTERPAKTLWTKPFLEPVVPLSVEAAQLIFEAISGKTDDYTTKLVQAVGCVPLAVYLLAYLAQSEDTAQVWERWEAESISMVHRGTNDQLSSVDFSIRLSLQSPRMAADPDALVLLGILSMLPDGLQTDKIQSFQSAFANMPYMLRALSTLRRNALVYSPQTGTVGVLSPIRLYMQAKHALSVDSINGLKGYYLPLASKGGDYTLPDVQLDILPEIGNLNFLLEFFFKKAALYDAIIEPTLKFCKFCQYINLYEQRLLDLVSGALQDSDYGLRGDYFFVQAKLCQFTSQAAKAEEYYKKALAMHEQAEDLSEQAHDLEYIGRLYYQLSRVDEARDYLNRALELHTQVGNKMGQGYDLQNLARISLGIAKFDEARDYLNRAQALHVETNTLLGQAYNIGYLGTIHMQLAEYEQAKEKMEEALKLHIKVKDVLGQANTVRDLGTIDMHLGKLEQAKAQFHQALILHKEACDFLGQANDLHSLGDIALQQNQLDEAEKLLKDALSLHTQETDIHGQANDYQELAHVYMHHTDSETAKEMLIKALNLHKQVQDLHGEAADLLALAKIDRHLGQHLEAIDKFMKAKDLYTYCQDKRGLAGTVSDLGTSYMALQLYDEALDNLNKALELHRETNANLGIGTDLQQIGVLYTQKSQPALAKEFLEKALAQHKSINHVLGQAYDYHHLGVLYMSTKTDKAIEMFEKAICLHVEGKDIIGEANALQRLGQAHMKSLHLEKAIELFSKALPVHKQVGAKYSQSWELYCLGMIHTHLSEVEKAEEELQGALKIHTEMGLMKEQGNDCKALGILYRKVSRVEEAEAMERQVVSQ